MALGSTDNSTMGGDQHQSRFQRGLLRLTLERGARWTIVIVTGASLTVSLSMTALSFLIFPTDRETVIVSIALATIIPMMVAPLATHVIIGLVLSVASANDELQRLATTDSLTGLANRRRFFTAAAGIITRHDPNTVTLVGMVDVDAFKLVNDRHGHAAGDAVLTTLAERLRRAVGDNTSVVGRLGGDEFGIVLTAPEDALVAVTDALERACSDIEIGPSDRAQATLGLCCPGGDGTNESIDDLLARADAALYAAKLARRLNPRASLV